ncbi:Ubiquitin carboxyl-terminal hydrolase 4 isoform X2 [Oopsacas minuta]|uniref:ubiquitinyl hydrolase 1 n=1 Tax=Oopsacas minuta TaxID=111878 RepID=A0AAV7JK49_9METZ|nr:Ubiquitin carboxyl-terminal hydrolase 4 isoform X2 [Oopsacas minuta]
MSSSPTQPEIELEKSSPLKAKGDGENGQEEVENLIPPEENGKTINSNDLGSTEAQTEGDMTQSDPTNPSEGDQHDTNEVEQPERSDPSSQNGNADDIMDTTNIPPEVENQADDVQVNGVAEKENSKADDVDSDPEDNPVIIEAPTYDLQKSEIQAQLSKPLLSGQKWYLIHIRWFKQWKRYVGYDNWDKSSAGEEVGRPGPIDNTSLLEHAKLRRHQVDEIDYKLVPEDAWKKLASWYGLAPDSRAISRRVVEYGKFVKQCKVEIYPLELKACLFPKESDFKIVRISRCDTIRVLEKKIRKAFSIEQSKEVRVYNRYMTYTYELIKDLNLEAQDVGLFDGQCVLLEVQNQDASWPRTNHATRSMQMPSNAGVTTRSQAHSTYSSTNSNYNYPYSNNYGYYSGRQPTTPGLCGLSNLGNTCFMNSGLQCLIHIPPLIEYFENDTYLKEINTKNPLGMKGELAKSFGELIKAMWSGDYAYLAPRDYKLTVGKFAPTFSGYAQQDSQEHISFLLDGLHEDLNRVMNKPYIELKELDKPDDIAAQESWDRHLMRNKSIIVDTFQGQYKSTLVCPECNKVSITFDPFMYLSLPLPIKKTRNIKLTLITLNPANRPTIFKVKIPKNSSVAELCEELYKLCGIEADRLVVCDVYSHRFHKIFEHSESVNGITERDDIFVYETPISSMDDSDLICLPMYNRELRRTQYTSIGTHSYVHHYLFGMPLVLPIPRDKTTYKDLYKICVYFMSRYIIIPEDYKVQLKQAAQAEQAKDDVDMENSDSGNDSDDKEDKKSNTDIQDGTIDTNNDPETGGDENPIEDEAVRSKPDSDDEPVGEMEVEGASAQSTSSYAYVPDDFDISQYPADMFKLKLVNAYGSAEMGELRDDENCLKLFNRSVIAMEWNSKYRHFYSESSLRDISEDESVHKKDIKREIHLADCIKLFTEKEILSKDDPWYCPVCEDFRQASKQLELWKIPDCLVIHLKRFSYNQYWRDKLDSLIHYPLELDMTEYTLSKAQVSLQYELYGVSNHFGGLGGGHYTAYAKQKNNSKWYNFDDSSVTSFAQNDSVVTKAGYLLFYVKKTCIPLAPAVAKEEKVEIKDADSDHDDVDDNAVSESVGNDET